MRCPSCKAENVAGAEWCASCDASLTGAAALGPGSVVAGRYEIVALLGKGGMGAVFKAHDRALDESVAIKVLRSDIGVTREMDRRFRAEIKLARRISHKNVCRIHEYGEDGELRYLSMTLVEGVDLKHVIAHRGRLPPEEAFDVALQVADGLQAIHDEGIVHRDLKTPNIMRDGKGVVRLMDFGIAKQWTGAPAGDQTATGMVVGTPEYMSPEQVRGEKVDGRSDIYALGIVLYEVFTGHVPFHADTPVATLWLQLKEPPPLDGLDAASIPAPILPILEKALAKEPERRYASAREMADDLRRARDLVLRPRELRSAPVLVSAAAPRLEAAAEARPLPTPVPAPTPTPARTARRPAPSAAAVPARVAAGSARPLQAPIAWRRAILVWAAPAFVIGALGAGILFRDSFSGRRVAQESGGAAAVASATPRIGPTPVAEPAMPQPTATPPPAAPSASPSPPPKPARLAAPGAVAPANGSELPPGIWPRLTWDSVAGASAYRIAISSDPSFEGPRIDRKQVETAFDMAPLGSELQPGESRRYYWRVAALDARGIEGPFSRAQRFTIARPATDAGRALPAAAPPSSQASGTLQLTVIPWAEVSIDDAPVQQGVPLRKIPLQPGAHLVRLVHPDYEPVQRRVTIRPGETRELTVDLPEEAVRRKH